MLARVFSRVSRSNIAARYGLGVARAARGSALHPTYIQRMLLANRLAAATTEQSFHSSALLQIPSTFRSSDSAGAAAAATANPTGHHLPVHSADEVFFNRHAIDILQEKGIVGRADTIDEDATIHDAAARILQLSPPASLIVMKNGHVSGLISERHILTCMATPPGESVFSDSKSWRVGKVMTPASKMVVVSPQDTVYECLSVMISAGVRQLPVLDGQTLVGVLGLRDVVQHQQAALEEVAGQGHTTTKAQFLTMILPRQGVPKNTAVLKAESSMLRLQSAATMIPHPHKKNSGEDAYLTWSYVGVEPTEKPHKKKKHVPHEPPRPTGLSVVAVADGVGSWSLEDGIDASLYSRGLLAHAKSYLEATAPQHPHLTPSQILSAAWHNISQEQVLGSSTVCILTIDGVARQLRAANVGDSGFLVLRNTVHIVAGTLQNTQDAASPLRVIFRSVQQLHAFNTPAQLGSHEGSKFETPHDADLMTLQVDDGDLIVLATDGLFDNLEEADIVQLLGDGSEDVFVLSQRLADAAYTASLNKDKDSPFALLAKDNNILWSGGHPDDITVLVSRVYNAPTTTAETNAGLTCSVPRT